MLSPLEIAFHDEEVPKHVTIYQPPDPKRHYVAGWDVSEGVQGGDPGAGHILDCETLEQVAVWHGRVPPDRLAHEAYCLGALYNWAHLACEYNGCGQVTCNVLHKELGYPNMYFRQNLGSLTEKASFDRPGFVTSTRTKPIILNRLARLIREDGIILHHKRTIVELRAFSYDETKTGQQAYGAPGGKDSHDDLVMALAIACEAHRQYVPPKEPDRDAAFYNHPVIAGLGIRQAHEREMRSERRREQEEWGQS